MAATDEMVRIAGRLRPHQVTLVQLRNDTPGGELVNVRAASIGDIVSRGTIGMARSRVVPGLALNPLWPRIAPRLASGRA